MPVHTRRFSASLALLLLLVVTPAAPQLVRLGNEIQVNSFTDDAQQSPAVGVAPNGTFVVVWSSQEQDGYAYGIFGQRFSSSGVALATEFQVNEHTDSYQSSPTLAVGGDGSFVVAWSSYYQDGSNYGIFARRFDASGQAVASEFQVNLMTEDDQITPAVARSPNGSFVVAWGSVEQDGSQSGVFARRFDAAGEAVGGEIQVNQQTEGQQLRPAVDMATDGGFVVVWDNLDINGGNFGVFHRRFDSAGAGLDAGDVEVAATTTATQDTPAVDLAADGSFVVAWTGDQDGFARGIFARRFSSAGVALGAELSVNDVKAGDQSEPDVQTDGTKGFLVVWTSDGQDGAGLGVFGRRFQSSGEALAGDVQIALHTQDDQSHPSIDIGGLGRFVVAWQSGEQDGSESGIFAQRFAKPAILDVDGNGTVDPLNDGLLTLRYEFEFTGATLTTGVVDLDGCTRCDADAITEYLDSLR